MPLKLHLHQPKTLKEDKEILLGKPRGKPLKKRWEEQLWEGSLPPEMVSATETCRPLAESNFAACSFYLCYLSIVPQCSLQVS